VTKKKEEAAWIIHSFSVCNGSIAFALANTAVGDAVLVSGLLVFMVNRLGKLFEAKDVNAGQVVAQCFTYYAGAFLTEKLLFWVPGIGNWANAGTTILLTQTVGWSSVAVFESGRRFSDLSKGEWLKILKTARSKAEKHQEENKALMRKMTASDRKEFQRINARMRDDKLTEDEKERMLLSLKKLYREIQARKAAP
jgi:uncharacterized protein (DUF697 family)